MDRAQVDRYQIQVIWAKNSTDINDEACILVFLDSGRKLQSELGSLGKNPLSELLTAKTSYFHLPFSLYLDSPGLNVESVTIRGYTA